VFFSTHAECLGSNTENERVFVSGHFMVIWNSNLNSLLKAVARSFTRSVLVSPFYDEFSSLGRSPVSVVISLTSSGLSFR
jgi:hypothetical protein